MKHLNTPTSIVKQFCFPTPAAACIADIRLQHKGQRLLRSKSSGELVESAHQCFGAVLSPHTRRQQPERSSRVCARRQPESAAAQAFCQSWLRRLYTCVYMSGILLSMTTLGGGFGHPNCRTKVGRETTSRSKLKKQKETKSVYMRHI